MYIYERNEMKQKGVTRAIWNDNARFIGRDKNDCERDILRYKWTSGDIDFSAYFVAINVYT